MRSEPHSLPFRLWRARYCYLFLAPSILLLFLFNLLPAIKGLGYAFMEIDPGGAEKWVGLRNFERIASDGILLRSITNLVILVVAGLLKALTLPLLAAVLISRLSNEKTCYFFQSSFVFPIVVPGMVTVLLWKGFIYEPEVGLLNSLLRLIGMASWQQAWLGEHSLAMASYLFLGFPWIGGTVFLIFYAGLLAIPQDVMEAAKLDGVGPIRRFINIELPLVLGQIRLIVVLTFIGTVQDFGGILLMTGGGPGAATHVPALHMYYMAFRFGEFGYASAIGFCLFVVILLLSIINLRVFRSRVED
jgi:ABC-type sugar transport system permease subunit